MGIVTWNMLNELDDRLTRIEIRLDRIESNIVESVIDNNKHSNEIIQTSINEIKELLREIKV